MRSGVVSMKTTYTCDGFSAVAIVRSFLEMGPQSEQRVARSGGELPCPAVVELPDRDRVQVVEARPSHLARRHEPSLLEHPDVLHHAEARDLEVGLELSERAAVLVVEQVEDRAARRIGQRPEHRFVHASILGD